MPGESQGQGRLVGCRLWGRTGLEKYVTRLRVIPVGLTASHRVCEGKQRQRQAPIHLSMALLISPLPENGLILQLV